MSEIKLSGAGSFDAGNDVYDYVGISGSGTVNGNLMCKSIHISGSGKVLGDTDCEGDIKISGSGKICGNVRADEVSISGSTRFEKNVKCNSFTISGAGKVLGDIETKKLRFFGAANANNISSEEAEISGAVNISGLLNSETVSVNLGGDCFINEIGCTNLTVLRKDSDGDSTVKLFGITICSSGQRGNGVLSAKLIEGDNINLEYTEADIVRGKKITIGKGCKIGKVEHSEPLIIDDDSVVKEQIQI